jgi:SAM-dependent methyltransferase
MSVDPAPQTLETTAEDHAGPTPVRLAVRASDPGEPVLLRDVGSGYRDGAEDVLLTMVRGSDDLASLNEELHGRATNWPERYHLDRQRANVLRAFDVSVAERVLEVGAGCGAMSRYLAERCRFVDALEPVPARAAVAAARLRDLPGARVFTGELADLPDEPSYDLVVVIGVLEYVGGGTADEAPYIAFLEEIRRRLRPGGRLLLAIENKLGVKYLAGSPEDHSDRAYDSIEGYPIGAPARTFDRDHLGRLFQQAGFSPTFFSAFPDYKLSRVVMSEELMTDPSGLAARLPRFPSPDWQTSRDFGPNEELLWKTLVEAGQGAQHGNSFVVLGSPDGAVDDLWPADRRAAFYTTERRPGRATQTLVERTQDGLAIVRTALGERRDDDGPAHRLVSGPVLAGRPLIDEIATGDLELARKALLEWRALVEAAAARADADGVPVDLVPHNVLIGEDGGLTFIDDEWRSREWAADDVVARGLIWLCERLSTTPSVWQSRPSRRALLTELAELIDFAPGSDWILPALHREAVLQTEILRRGRGQEGFEAEVARTEAELATLLELPMNPSRPKLGPLIEEGHQLRAARAEAEARAAATAADLLGTQQALAAAGAELAAIHGSVGFRLIERFHRIVEKVAPQGTHRRSVYRRVGEGLRRPRS